MFRTKGWVVGKNEVLIHLHLSVVYVQMKAFSIIAMGTIHLKLSLVQLLLRVCVAVIWL